MHAANLIRVGQTSGLRPASGRPIRLPFNAAPAPIWRSAFPGMDKRWHSVTAPLGTEYDGRSSWS